MTCLSMSSVVFQESQVTSNTHPVILTHYILFFYNKTGINLAKTIVSSICDVFSDIESV